MVQLERFSCRLRLVECGRGVTVGQLRSAGQAKASRSACECREGREEVKKLEFRLRFWEAAACPAGRDADTGRLGEKDRVAEVLNIAGIANGGVVGRRKDKILREVENRLTSQLAWS